MNPVEQYFFKQIEPYQSIMLYVRSVILKTLPKVEEKFNYGIPFYHYNKRPLIYLNILKGTNFVDVAFVQGVILQEKFPELKDYKNRKNVRSLQIKSIKKIDELLLIALVKEAISLTQSTKSAWKP